MIHITKRWDGEDEYFGIAAPPTQCPGINVYGPDCKSEKVAYILDCNGNPVFLPKPQQKIGFALLDILL